MRRGILPTYPELYEQPNFSVSLPQGRVVRDLPARNWVLRPSSVAGEQYAEVSKSSFQTVHDILSHRVAVPPALKDLESSLQYQMRLRKSGTATQ